MNVAPPPAPIKQPERAIIPLVMWLLGEDDGRLRHVWCGVGQRDSWPEEWGDYPVASEDDSVDE